MNEDLRTTKIISISHFFIAAYSHCISSERYFKENVSSQFAYVIIINGHIRNLYYHRL